MHTRAWVTYSSSMSVNDSGRTRTVAIVALLLAVVAVVALGGLALGAIDPGSDERTGEEILSDVAETYDNAESVSSDAVVTVEALNSTTQFELSAAAAGDDRLRMNVSEDGEFVLTGVNNGTIWRYDSVTELTGVVDSDGDTVIISLRGGTETPARPGLSALPGDVGLDTELSTVLTSFDGDLPEEFEDQLDGLPANATLGDVLMNDSLAGSLDRAALTGGSGGLPENFEEVNFEEFDPGEFEFGQFEFPQNLSGDELPQGFEEFDFEEFDPEEFDFEEFDPEEFEFPQNLSGDEFPQSFEQFNFSGEWNRSDLRERLNESLTGGFNSSAVTVEHNGTTTIDGTEANELLVTYPDTELETRLFTAVESDVILRQETTAPDVTVTVDVQETRFDVSPADSTFEPPGATELASLSLATADSPVALESAAPFGTATPGDDWSFEGGAVLAGESLPLTAATGVEAGDIAGAVYTDESSTLVIGQSADALPLERLPGDVVDTETVGDREVRLATTSDISAGAFVEDGTTVVVAGDLPASELRAVIDNLDL